MEIYGHRGARGEAPENTIAGCRHAIGVGVRRIEIDLRLSSDGELVVLHDETLDRTTGVAGRPGDFSVAELAAMDARGEHRHWPSGAPCGVPSLDALLEATPEIGHYQLEVKDDRAGVLRVIAHRLADRFPPQADTARFAVTSFSVEFLNRIKDAAPLLARGIVASEPGFQHQALAAGCRYACLHFSLCRPEVIRSLHEEGMHVSAWTVNDADLAKRLRDWGVDSIITDFPSRMLPWAAAGAPA